MRIRRQSDAIQTTIEIVSVALFLIAALIAAFRLG